ncbi:hypothetical protein NT6N_10070 [Oceaniferula spumae]|uniref:Biopolymer transporter ExbD n=1 Tax=Oceaniferula spumae TaxID=2979115 RepID=A0AAT9FJ50_9BACT
MRYFLTAWLLSLLTFPVATAKEDTTTAVLTLQGNAWVNAAAADKDDQPWIDPATTHLTIKAAAETPAKKIMQVLGLTYRAQINTVTLSTTGPTSHSATYKTADLTEFIQAAKHPNQGGLGPYNWGFDCFLSHGKQTTHFDSSTLGNFELKAPFTMESFGKELKKAVAETDAKDHQLLFVSHDAAPLSELIDLVSHLQLGKLDRMLLLLNDEVIKMMQVEVKQDPHVSPPIARKDGKVRFPIEVTETGILKVQNAAVSDEALVPLIKKFKEQNPKGLLEIKADKGVDFKHIRRVIRLGASAGLQNVVFSVKRQTKKPKDTTQNGEHKAAAKALRKLVESTIKPREEYLRMQLPAVPAGDANAPAIAPLFIGIGSEGEIWVNQGAAKEIVETDVKQRKLPTLTERIVAYTNAARAAGQDPIVKITANKKAQQIRVVDVLNALAAEKVNRVSFVDLVDE